MLSMLLNQVNHVGGASIKVAEHRYKSVLKEIKQVQYIKINPLHITVALMETVYQHLLKNDGNWSDANYQSM